MNRLKPLERTIRILLLCGVLAGPLFLLTIVMQIFTRTGYDFGHQPISFLSLGDGGWVQIVDFLVGGLLAIGFAAAVRRILHTGPGRRWVPLLIAGFGAGLVIAGLFPPDPAFGFPPGTPEGMPQVMTYRSVLHGVGFTLCFASLIAACFVMAFRDGKDKKRGHLWYSVATAMAALALSQWPGMEGASLRYFLAAVVAWTWISVLSLRLMAIKSGTGALA